MRDQDEREPQDEARATTRSRLDGEGSSVTRGNLSRDGEAESRPLARGFGREEWIEDARAQLLRHAGPIVLDDDLDGRRQKARRHADQGGAKAAHRLPRVGE